MCGRISQYSGIHDFVAALSMPNALANSVGDQPIERYNVAPTTQVALLHVQGELLLAEPVRWGWRPHWAKDRAAPINARAEKVAHGPFFRAIWPHRAITPIDNWFEWVDEGGPKKQPYLIRRRDGAPIFCAAIGQLPDADEGQGEHDGFVIITADSAGGMVDIHDRRPVVLTPDLAREWLDPATPKERAEQMVLHQGDAVGSLRVVQSRHRGGKCEEQGAGSDPANQRAIALTYAWQARSAISPLSSAPGMATITPASVNLSSPQASAHTHQIAI